MTKEAKYTMGENLSIRGIGNIGQIYVKNEIRPLSYDTHKNKLNLD